MFSTGIFRNKPLGHNESLEIFPVGKRLAFDAARGRHPLVDQDEGDGGVSGREFPGGLEAFGR